MAPTDNLTQTIAQMNVLLANPNVPESAKDIIRRNKQLLEKQLAEAQGK